MKKYGYTTDGINYEIGSQKQIADLVLRGMLNLDSTIQDTQTLLWCKVRELPSIKQEIEKPAINLSFHEPSMDNFLVTGQLTLYYSIPIAVFVIGMLVGGEYFLLYWLFRNALAINASQKKKKKGLTLLLNSIMFWRTFEHIERDARMNEIERASFSATSVSRKIWIFIAAPLVLGYLGLNTLPYHLDLIVDTLFYCWLVYSILPVQKYINSVNQKIGNPYSSRGFGYYFIVAVMLMLILLSLSGINRSSIFKAKALPEVQHIQDEELNLYP